MIRQDLLWQATQTALLSMIATRPDKEVLYPPLVFISVQFIVFLYVLLVLVVVSVQFTFQNLIQEYRR